MHLTELIYLIFTAFATWVVTKTSDKIAAFFSHVMAKIFRGKRSYRRAIATNLNKSLNKIKQEMFPDNSLKKVKIETADVEDPEVDQFDNKTIVRVSTKKSITETYKRVAEVYAKEVLIGRTYNYLTPVHGESTVDFCGREICSVMGHAKATEKLDDQIILKSKNDLDYRLDIERYETLRKHRLFFSIFIPEIRRFGKVIGITKLNIQSSINKDFEKLLNFLINIAEKEQGQKVRLKFNSTLLKIAIVLVAAENTWTAYGTNAYVKRVKKLIDEGYESIYIIGAGYKTEYVDKVVKDLKKDVYLNFIKKDYKISDTTTIRIYKVNVE